MHDTDVGEIVQSPIRDPRFFLGGKAIFTITVPDSFIDEHPGTNSHYTFKVQHKPANGKYSACYWVFLLTGPDNMSDFTYIGRLDPETMKVNKKGFPQSLVERILMCAIDNNLDRIEQAGWKLVHEGRCCVCGRRLTVPASIEAGIGPECAGRMS